MYPHFSFTVTHAQGSARRGRLSTPHGTIETPAFIFCATKGAMRVATPAQLKQAHTQIILGNTYHLYLQPGTEKVAAFGGLHQFMGWDGPMLTDSGGFQIFSLGHGLVADEIKGRGGQKYPKTLLKITEEGATFRSYVDGQIHHLSPEKAMDIQRALGADLVLVLDECTPFHVDKSYTEKSLRMSHRWGKRSLAQFTRHNDGKQALYGIVQGGTYPDLRAISSGEVSADPFFGTAIGGSLGDSRTQMVEVVGMALDNLDKSRPIHLLGIGGLRDIWHNVAQGIDTFDCVHPTRLARHGGALVANKKERIHLRNARFGDDTRPIDATCDCYTCLNFSRGYLHHLVTSGEPLGYQLLAIHNIHFMNHLMQTIRTSLEQGTFASDMQRYIGNLEQE
jgi:queuine tRNA-ribosyltransferase